jgi:hypothetical protein
MESDVNILNNIASLLVIGGVLSACGSAHKTDASSSIDAVVGAYGAATIDLAKTTHIIAIGYSHGQGTQFVQAAIGRAQKYREVFPHDQIVVLGQPEVSADTADNEVFRNFGISVTEYDPHEELNSNNLLARLGKFSAIASFDYYGHSSPWSIGVSSTGQRFGTDSVEQKVKALSSHFTGDAYASLNGCNAGLFFAPHLSKLWQIPVAGAATGTNFQRLHENGKWYVNDEGRFPAGNWARTNAVSFKEEIRCSKGVCLRLKPENSPYKGYWGDETAGGLGFVKFFCKSHGSMSECTRRMALSLLTYESIAPVNLGDLNEANFQSTAFDYLCPNDKSGAKTAACKAGILGGVLAGNEVLSVFSGNELVCGFNGCEFKYRCDTDSAGQPIPGTCHLSGERNLTPKNLIREYKALMEGFRILKETGLRGGANGGVAASGPIPDAILTAAASFTVNSSTLNCRREADLASEIALILEEGAVLAKSVDASGSAIHIDGRGIPWVRVMPAGQSESCFVSGQYQFLSVN